MAERVNRTGVGGDNNSQVIGWLRQRSAKCREKKLNGAAAIYDDIARYLSSVDSVHAKRWNTLRAHFTSVRGMFDDTTVLDKMRAIESLVTFVDLPEPSEQSLLVKVARDRSDKSVLDEEVPGSQDWGWSPEQHMAAATAAWEDASKMMTASPGHPRFIALATMHATMAMAKRVLQPTLIDMGEHAQNFSTDPHGESGRRMPG